MEATTRNMFVSMFSGALFSIGWWIFIAQWNDQLGEVHDQLNSTGKFNETLYDEIISSSYNPLWAICSLGTIGLIMVNTVGNSVVQGDGFGADGETCLARVYVFTGFLLLFSTLISSIWVMTTYLSGDSNTSPYKIKSTGWGLFAQNLLIFLSACIFKFLRDESAWGMF